MATTAYQNQFMRDLDKKCTIFFNLVAQLIVVHNSHMLSNGVFISNDIDSLQLTYISKFVYLLVSMLILNANSYCKLI